MLVKELSRVFPRVLRPPTFEQSSFAVSYEKLLPKKDITGIGTNEQRSATRENSTESERRQL